MSLHLTLLIWPGQLPGGGFFFAFFFFFCSLGAGLVSATIQVPGEKGGEREVVVGSGAGSKAQG